MNWTDGEVVQSRQAQRGPGSSSPSGAEGWVAAPEESDKIQGRPQHTENLCGEGDTPSPGPGVAPQVQLVPGASRSTPDVLVSD